MVTKERRFSSNVTDPVADLLTRIRNANLAYKDDLAVPVSKVNESVLRILDAEGYIDGFERDGEGVHQAFRVRLKYDKKRQRTISGIKRVSTPGRRVYARKDRLPRVLGGLGTSILSTSSGVITGRQAAERGVGGEVIAFIW